MNTPNNLEWAEDLFDGIRLTCDECEHPRCRSTVASAKQTIATKLAEAYKQGGVDELKMAQANHNTEQMIGKYLEDRIATLTNDKEDV
jgi:hypothetical protein